jgi:NAD(P)-dependent dehydrogenase (short-subunit alcohol dehydrogenase family)
MERISHSCYCIFMSERFEDKIAIVTGAASGIGFATASKFAQEGAQVVAVDIDGPRLQRFTELSGTLHKVDTRVVDVGDSLQVKETVAKVLGTYGCINILVNSAAVFDMRALDAVTEQDIDASRRVNVHGARHFVDTVGAAMVEAGTLGSIVNVSSVSGMGAEVTRNVYSMTKKELLDFTTTAALRWGRHGIRVNAVSPGPILTEASYKHLAQTDMDEATFLDGIRATTLIERMGEPKEVAGPILFLASDEASYMMGSNLVVDGGFNLLHN